MVEGKYVRGPRGEQAGELMELGAELWLVGGSSVEEEEQGS